MSRSYIDIVKEKAKQLKHSGVKGMRWGVRRERSELRAAAKARSDSPAKKETTDGKSTSSSGGSEKKSSGNIQDNVESSSARYDRLAGQAKSGRSSDMSEQDLKFFNARTDALNKVNKMYEENPSWLKSTSTKVLQQTAQNQMQSLADGLATKYIGDPIKTALKGTEPVKSFDQQAKEAAAKEIGDDMMKTRVSDLVTNYKAGLAAQAAKNASEESVVDAAATTAIEVAKAATTATTTSTKAPLAGQSLKDAMKDIIKGAKEYNSTGKTPDRWSGKPKGPRTS